MFRDFMLSLSKDNVLQYDDNNEMQDANIETPRTPAKALKSHHEIAIPSTMMGMEKMGQNNVTDIVLRERYSDVQLIGTGEFSIVYAASEKATSSGFEPARFAIKRTKTPFVGPKARSRRNEEVEILRNLTFSNKSSNEDDHEYIVNLIDAWELRVIFTSSPSIVKTATSILFYLSGVIFSPWWMACLEDFSRAYLGMFSTLFCW